MADAGDRGKAAGLAALIAHGLSGGTLVALNRALGVLITVLMTRLMLQADYGVYLLSIAAATLIGLPLSSGLPTLVLREMKTFNDAQAFALLHGLLRRAIGFALALSGVIVGVVLGIGWLRPDWIGIDGVVLLAVLLVPIIALNLILNAAIRAFNRPVLAIALVNLVTRAVMLGGIAMFWLGDLPLGPGTAVALHLLAEIVLLASLCRAVWQLMPFRMRDVARHPGRGWLGDLVPLTLSGGFPMLNAQIGLVAVGLAWPPAEATLLRIATQAVLLVEMGGLIAVTLNGHRFAAGEAERRTRSYVTVIRETATLGFLLSVPVAIMLAFFGRPIIGLVFGDSYLGAVGPMLVMLGAQVLSVATGPTVMMLNMARHAHTVMVASATAALINVLVCIVAVQHWGALGAAVAAAVSMMVFHIVLLTRAITGLGVDPTPFGLATRLGLGPRER